MATQKKTSSSKKSQDSGKTSTGKKVAVALGTAAAVAAVGAAVKAVVGSKRTVYEVKAHDKGWQVIEDDASRASSVHPTKKEAVSAGRKLAGNKAPSELHIYKQDGGLESSHSYEVEE